MDKPHKGNISGWSKVECSHGLGYYIMGWFENHPDFSPKYTNTSWVEKHDTETGEIETRNSRYRLIGDETA